MTDVVAALIWDRNRFLACQRPAHKARGLLWEFVGGKVEPGETKEEALIRECREELDIEVMPESVFMELVHEYPDLTVRLTLFNAKILAGTPKMLEHNDLRWMMTQEIDNYDFCPADVEILEKLKTIDSSLQAELISMAEPSYRDFQSRLLPTVFKERILGVRIPLLRKLAAQLKQQGRAEAFMEQLPHHYFEEDLLHAILINGLANPIHALDVFLPYVNNWSVCDTLAPRAFSSANDDILRQIREWLQSGHTYTARFAVGSLMRFYMTKGFSAEHLEWICRIQTDDYYLNMGCAWYFATALAKQYASAIVYLEKRLLTPEVHRMTIRKAIESFRITNERKAYIRTLK